MPRSIEAEDIFRLMMVGDAQISPDGRSIAYVQKTLDRDADEYRSSIYIWQGGESRRYTAGEKDSAPRWSPDGRWLAFLSGREGKAQIYLLPTAGGEAIQLTDLPLGAGTPVWAPSSDRVACSAPVSTSEEEAGGDGPPRVRVIERARFKLDGTGFVVDRRRQVFVIDLPAYHGDSPVAQQITHGDFNHADPVWAPDGAHLALSANRNPDWDLEALADIWVVPAGGGQLRRITTIRGQWSGPAFSPDGSRIACVGFPKPEGERTAAFPQLWSFSRGGGDGHNLMAGIDLAVDGSVSSDWSAAGESGIIWLDDGLYCLIACDGASAIYRWNESLLPLTAGRRHIMDFSVAGSAIAYTVSDPTRPAEICRLENGQIETVAAANAEWLAGVGVVTPERIEFSGADGATITGWLMKPVGWTEGRRYGLIVYIHGGPVAAYGETFFHEFQTLAAAGFGVFYCNPHGSSSYGCDFQESIVGDWGNRDYQDVMAGVDRVLAEPWVDPNRLGVAGGSYGGFMVNWIIGHSDRFAAACAQRSICNMVSQGGTSDWAATRGERLLATPEGDPDRLWAMSPLKYAAQVHTPTLVIHSERDDRCPVEQGEQWFMALKRQGVPTRFVRFPEESHGLSRTGKPSRRIERMEQIIRWFRTYL